MDNLFFHDSRQKKYRSIFGAASAGARVTLRLDVFWEETKEVDLHLYEETGKTGKESIVPMEPSADKHAYSVELQLPDKGCLIWYYFIIKGNSIKYYGNNPEQKGGAGAIYDNLIIPIKAELGFCNECIASVCNPFATLGGGAGHYAKRQNAKYNDFLHRLVRSTESKDGQ